MNSILRSAALAALLVISGSVIAYPTGAVWQWSNPLPTGNPGYGIAYGNGEFIVAGPHQSLRHSSNGGFTWGPEVPLGNGNARDVIFGGNQFLMVGDFGFMLTSSDGNNWLVQTSGTSSSLNAALFAGGQYVAAGTQGTVLTSPDAVTWTSHQIATQPFINDVTYNGSFYVAVTREGKIYTSPGAVNWAAEPSPVSTPLNSVTWNGSLFIAVGAGTTGIILSSSDGVSWTQQTTPSGIFGLNDVIWDGTQFIVVGTNAAILTSANGINWNPAVTITSGQQFYKIIMTPTNLASGQYFITGDGGLVITMHTILGTPFMRSPNPHLATQKLSNVNWNGSQFVAVGQKTPVLHSPDGVTWSQASANVGMFNDLTWDGSQYIAVGSGANTWTSADATTWVAHGLPGSYNLLGVIMRTSGLFIAVGESGRIVTSNDGSSWTNRVSGGSDALISVAASASRIVAVGLNGAITSSSDGVSWSWQTSGIAAGADINSVIHAGPANFVAVGSGATILTSNDGLTWTKQAFNGLNSLLQSVMWDGNQYLAVGDTGSCIRSLDAVTWQNCSSDSVNDFYAIAGNTNVVVAVGDFGSILSSVAANEAPSPTAPAITTNQGNAATSQVTPNDPDVGDTETFAVTSMPSNGTASVDGSGLVTYTPNASTSGSDSLTITVTDAAGLTGTVSIAITINSLNHPPVVTIPAISVQSGFTATSQTAVTDPDVGATKSFSITTAPAHGLSTISVDGLVNYSAAIGYSGSDSLVVTVTDSAGATGNATLAITVTAPPAPPPPPVPPSSGGGGGSLFWLLAILPLGRFRSKNRTGQKTRSH